MYGYEPEDFYEPSEIEIMFMQLKHNLLKTVKEEYVVEMERLKKENEELLDVKVNFETVKRDYENKKRQLESEYQKLKSNVRSERLVDLLKDHKIVMYKAYSKKQYPPKCDKCDKYRKIQYVSPLGRNTSEDCLCKDGKLVYYPEEYIRYEFRLNPRENNVTAWYRKYSDDGDGFTYDSSIHANSIYSSNINFKDVNEYNTFFKTKEECQAYCDWINENNK